MTGMQMDGGATSLGAAASFLGMWVAMMAAMMLPSLAPTLWRYRHALDARGIKRAKRLTAVVGVGYLFVWTVFGLVVHPLVVALTSVCEQVPELARATPVIVASIIVIAGVAQLSAWKARQLARCREAAGLGHAMQADTRTAWRHGLCLGRSCILSCAGPMASLLAIGMMNVRVMAVVTTAITLERLLPAGEKAARAIGVGAIATGALMVVRAMGWLVVPG